MKEILPLKSVIASLKEQVKRTGTGHGGGRTSGSSAAATDGATADKGPP
jgi:hypothetical protein